MPPSESEPGPASERVRVRRGAPRAVYDPTEIHRILDAAPIAHVGVTTDDGPVVLPMAFGRDGDVLYLHGALANAVLRAAVDHEVCVTVTLVDGLVVARTPFHNSMNYRSVVVRGVGRRVTGDEHVRALRVVTDHVVAQWDTGRPPTPQDLRATMVVAVPLDEVSAKVRAGDPVDEPEDLAGPHWAGVVPLRTVWGAPEPAADLVGGVQVPDAVAALEGRPVG